MNKVKIGFVSLQGYPFDEKWGAELKSGLFQEISKLQFIELIHPAETLTKNGLVWDDNDAEKVVELIREKKVEGILIGTMTFGDKLARARVTEEFKNYPVAVFWN